MRTSRFAWYLLVAPLVGGVAFIVWMQLHFCFMTTRGCAGGRMGAYDVLSVFLVAYTFGLPPAILGAVTVGLLERRWARPSLLVVAAVGALAAAWCWAVYEVVVFRPVFGLRYGALFEIAVPFIGTAAVAAMVAELGLRRQSAPAAGGTP